jgi:hypothetical protein
MTSKASLLSDGRLFEAVAAESLATDKVSRDPKAG